MHNTYKSICYSFCLGLFLMQLFSCSGPINEQTDSNLGQIEDSVMVVTAHPLATQVGVDILRVGGNAFDAAVAVQFALAVVYPRAGNIAGGGFVVFRLADGEIGSLDFRETAPKLAHQDMYLDSAGNVDSDKSKAGIFSVGVSGTVAGMEALQRKYGVLPWDKVMAPALQLAIVGFELTAGEAEILNRYREVFLEQNGPNPFVKDELWKVGDIVTYPDLGEALFRIGEKGSQEFYNSRVAFQIIAESKRRGGLLTLKDLQDYKPVWRKPVRMDIGEFSVISMGPPSSGGIAVSQLLKGAEMFNIKQYPHNSAKAVHLMTELERRVFADRATYLGDPDFYDVPQEMLLSDEYLKNRFSDIDLSKSTLSRDVKAGTVEVIESHETTHFSIVDLWGNAISITTTLNGNFGSKVIVKGAGFFLNNEMDDFSIKPGVPNQFGLVGGEANAIASQKRMLSSMTPTIVEKNGKLWMVLGTPGGSTIITNTYQTIQNAMWYDMTMQEAVNATKTHSQWLPNYVYLEKGKMDTLVVDSLKSMGHDIEYWGIIGKMNAIMVLDNGNLEGAPDYTRGENNSGGF